MVALRAIESDKAVNKRPRIVGQHGIATAAIRPAAKPMTATHGGMDANRLEYLIAQRPNRDNPFKTRANRKRRALFLMRNGYGMQTAA